MVSSLLLASAWLYAFAIFVWWLLQRRFGDSVWWLGLLTPFAPLLFLPTGLLLFGALFWAGELLVPFALVAALFLLQYGAYFWPNAEAPTVDGQAKEQATFTVMTFNTWWISQQRETAKVPLQNVLSRSGQSPQVAEPADLVAIQELEPKMADFLLAEVGPSYPYHHLDVGGQWPQRLGVFSQFPLTPLDAGHLQARNFRIQIVHVAFPDRPFLLYNIHPRATNIMHYVKSPRTFIKRVGQSFSERSEFIHRMLDDIAERDEPVLVTGDFNSTDLSDVYGMMSEKLTDAHRAAGWGLGYTFPTHGADFKNLPVPRRFMRLDMIFYSDEFFARQCQVGRVHGESDHLPVLAEFMLR